MGKWSYSSSILDLCTRWWAVRFTSRPHHPGETVPCAHGIEGWVGTTADLDVVEYGKTFCPYRESNPGRTICSRRYTDWATLALPTIYTYNMRTLKLGLNKFDLIWTPIKEKGLLMRKHGGETRVQRKEPWFNIYPTSILFCYVGLLRFLRFFWYGSFLPQTGSN
jgi:hypothetical protein